MNKFFHKLFLFTTVFISIFSFNRCTSPVNDPYETEITEEGCLVDQGKSKTDKLLEVDVFVETSGSMGGYMPNTVGGKTNTQFQESVVNLINKIQSEAIKVNLFQIIDTNKPIHKLDQSVFNANINNGKFVIGSNTDIPTIIDSLISRKKARPANPTILISDLIFSPADGATATLKQISGEIEKRFSNTNFVSSLFCFESEFHSPKSVVKNSPYYFWMFGKSEELSRLGSITKSIAKTYEEIEFGFITPKIKYSILPDVSELNAVAVECPTDQNYYMLTDLAPSSQGTTFWIGLNLENVPKHIRENLTSTITFIEEGEYKAKVETVSKVSPATNSSDIAIDSKNKFDYYVKLNVNNMARETTLIRLNLINQRKPAWIQDYNEDVNSNNRKGTFGLARLIEGLNNSYKNPPLHILEQEVKFLLTTKSL